LTGSYWLALRAVKWGQTFSGHSKLWITGGRNRRQGRTGVQGVASCTNCLGNGMDSCLPRGRPRCLWGTKRDQTISQRAPAMGCLGANSSKRRATRLAGPGEWKGKKKAYARSILTRRTKESSVHRGQVDEKKGELNVPMINLRAIYVLWGDGLKRGTEAHSGFVPWKDWVPVDWGKSE